MAIEYIVCPFCKCDYFKYYSENCRFFIACRSCESYRPVGLKGANWFRGAGISEQESRIAVEIKPDGK